MAGGKALDLAVDAVLETFAQGPFIFNLGHGILPETPIAHVIEFHSRSTKRGEQFQGKFQSMYDEGIQIALKYFGE